jgi:mRNA-degrading endonuclease RelE of RelBE toxin-antitoxin system
MPQTWELNFKPAFLTDFVALPSEKVKRQVQHGVEGLLKDPRPDGHTRKKLKCHQRPVYRLRTGDYRVIYTFGQGWVRLLAVKKHHDGYDDDSIGYEEPAAVPPPDDGGESLSLPINASAAPIPSSPCLLSDHCRDL